MNAPERPQEVPHRRPKTLDGVDMHLAGAVPILIARPLPSTVADCLALALDPVVALPLIGVDAALGFGEAMHMGA